MNNEAMLAAVPMIGFGEVRHTRLKPVRHAFVYGTYFLLLPMRTLAREGSSALARNRWAPLSFYDADHGDGRAPSKGGALAWLDELLAEQGIDGADGEVWLHCYPRVLGFAFKPVSFWYCHTTAGALRAQAQIPALQGQQHTYFCGAWTGYGFHEDGLKSGLQASKNLLNQL